LAGIQFSKPSSSDRVSRVQAVPLLNSAIVMDRHGSSDGINNAENGAISLRLAFEPRDLLITSQHVHMSTLAILSVDASIK